MTGNNLDACLKQFSLEKYCDDFHSKGINTCSDLVSLTMQDYPFFGVTSMKDREKLFHLIQSVKVAEENGKTKGTPQKSAVIKGDKNKENCRISNEQDSTVKDKSYPVKRTKGGVNESSSTDKTAIPDKPAKSANPVRIPCCSNVKQKTSSGCNITVKPPDTQQDGNDSDFRSKIDVIATESGYNYGVPSSKPKLSVTKKGSSEARIRVCVRKRPLSAEEKQGGELDIVEVTGTDVITVYAPKVSVDLSKYTQTYPFVFDEAFDESCNNEEVYARTAKPLIRTVFNRGKATCFCYGCTGSGKTYTMLGNDKVQGLYILAARDIFTTLHSSSQGEGLSLWVSFFEIYCGQLFDLLNGRAKLHARENASHKVCINGLTELEVQNVEELMELIDYGNTVRSTGSTGVNADSSRSHAVLQLEVKSDGGTKPIGRFSFIDLAGSERAADVTDTDRQTRMEGAEINQSLLALKECIRALDQDSKHTPFRQSKLTQVLKDSFVGNSHTCMIANISPNMSSSENTLNTLRYASRAKELRRTDALSPRPATVAGSNFNFWSEEKNMIPKSNKNLPKLRIEEIRKEAHCRDLSKALERINMSDLEKLGNIRPSTTSDVDCRETSSPVPGRMTRANVLKVPKSRKGTSVTQSYNLSTPVSQLAATARPLTSPAVTPSKANSGVKNLLKPQSRKTPMKRNNNYLFPSTNATRSKDVIKEEANTTPQKEGTTGSSQFIISKVSETEVKVPMAANNYTDREQKLPQPKSTPAREPNRLSLNKKRSNVLSKLSSSSSNLGDAALPSNNTDDSPPLPNTRYSNKSFKARLSRLFNGKTSETRPSTGETAKVSVDESKLKQTNEASHSIREMNRMKTYPLLHREHGHLTLTQEQIIAAHHTQLAQVTGLCQEEMVLLRKVDCKDQRFTDYISQLDDILLQKAMSIDTLRHKIASYSAK